MIRLGRQDAGNGAQLVVRAHGIRVLSDDLSRALVGRIINIHHSCPSSFKGAERCHRADDRGVTIIGAPAHPVIADLDERPIIGQATARLSHALTAGDYVAQGRDFEARALMNGVRTVVFARV